MFSGGGGGGCGGEVRSGTFGAKVGTKVFY